MAVFFQNPDVFIPLLAMIALLSGSALCSASETALFFLTDEEVKALQVSKNATDQRIVALLKDPDHLLTALLFWNLVINLSIFALGVVITERLIALEQHTAAGTLSFVTLIAVICFGEVMPKTTAVLFRKPLARVISVPITLLVKTFDPLAPTFKAMTRSLRRMFWPEITKEDYLSPDDLEQAIDNSAGDSVVARQERQVLHNILDLSEVSVEEVMRPRGTYQAIVPPVSLAQLRGQHRADDYLVIAARNGEDVEGVVPLAMMPLSQDQHLEKLAKPVVHVPWCAKTSSVLQRLEDDDCLLASVVNEFGETIGIVTYDDIVDTILAPDPSRNRRLMRREPILEVAPDRFHVDGITSLRFLSQRLHIDYDAEEEDSVTVTGLFHGELERIPELGDECQWRGLSLRVIETARRGQIRVLVAKQETPVVERES